MGPKAAVHMPMAPHGFYSAVIDICMQGSSGSAHVEDCSPSFDGQPQPKFAATQSGALTAAALAGFGGGALKFVDLAILRSDHRGNYPHQILGGLQIASGSMPTLAVISNSKSQKYRKYCRWGCCTQPLP